MGKRWTNEMQQYADNNRQMTAKQLASILGVSIGTVYGHTSVPKNKQEQQPKVIERPKAEYSNKGYLYLINNV